jgi:microcystin-dependent protein
MPYTGEIRLFAGNFAPAGWALCQGQSMPISENDALFALLGTTYGGDGQETFNLPDLQGRAPVHFGQGAGISQTYQIGESGGAETVTLNVNQMPIHNHGLFATTDAGTSANPEGNVLAAPPTSTPFLRDTPSTQMANGALEPVGGSQPHENMQPFLVVNFIISLFGVFPPQ